MTLRAFLDLPDGMAVRVGVDGVLIGRHRTCDVQLADETASRRHALVRVAGDAVELVVLGRHPVDCNGAPCTAVHTLAPGDRLRFPGFECQVRVEHHEDSVGIAYRLVRGRERFQILASPYIVGTSPAARVVIAGWPGEALRFQLPQGVLVVELAEPGGTLNGAALAAGAPTALQAGDQLGYGGETFRIEQADDGDASTVLTSPSTAPTAVVLRPLPRGGRITFTFADGDRTVYVPGRRYQLLAALLAPPSPHVAGDYLPDAELVPLVWNDTDEVGGRQDINVVLTRCRQDLVAAGIAATSLVERAPGGRATRVVLAAGAIVRTQTDAA